MKLQYKNPWCIVVDGVDHGDEVVRVIEKCHSCEYDVVRRLEIYKDEEESDEITYVERKTYQNYLEFLMRGNKDEDEGDYGILDEGEKIVDTMKSYSDNESKLSIRKKPERFNC